MADVEVPGIATWWRVQVHRPGGEIRLLALGLACSLEGRRLPQWERRGLTLLLGPPAEPLLTVGQHARFLKEHRG